MKDSQSKTKPVKIKTYTYSETIREMEDPIRPHKLFGGAIDLAFPDRFVDVSEFRSVPDNQEVGLAGCSMPIVRAMLPGPSSFKLPALLLPQP
jgi:hypothetical protein